MSFEGLTIDLSPADLLADLSESPGVVAEATLSPLDLFWLEWLGAP